MNRYVTALVAGSIGLALAAPVLAQTSSAATPVLDKREANQQRRIEQGTASGQLTPREEGRLKRRADRLEAHEAKAKADGVVTPGERARLERETNRNSHVIAREKHDRQRVTK